MRETWRKLSESQCAALSVFTVMLLGGAMLVVLLTGTFKPEGVRATGSGRVGRVR